MDSEGNADIQEESVVFIGNIRCKKSKAGQGDGGALDIVITESILLTFKTQESP